MYLHERFQTSTADDLRRPETPYPRGFSGVSGLRYYSPGLGRWASRDPIGELDTVTQLVSMRDREFEFSYRKVKPHLYAAFFNNPLVYVDADGRDESYWPPGNNAPTYRVILPIDPPAAPTGCPAATSGLDLSFFGPWCRDRDFPHEDPDDPCKDLECYRSLPGVSGQQCCYDEDGDLAPGEAGTSPDIISPASGKDAEGNCMYEDWDIFCGHVICDWLPAVLF